MNICSECKHMRSGRAIDRRVSKPGFPAPIPRGGLPGSGYICARHLILPGRVHPQTGHQDDPSGEACLDLNPAGECTDYVPGNADKMGPLWLWLLGISAAFGMLWVLVS